MRAGWVQSQAISLAGGRGRPRLIEHGVPNRIDREPAGVQDHGVRQADHPDVQKRAQTSTASRS
jgi:hypothetical protein